ncbi:MAG: hypothetical protein AAGU02_10090, partial [Lawsonibacter sp.]
VLGLLAWIVPFIGISRQFKEHKPLRGSTCVAVSLGSCALSLWMQIRYNLHLVDIRDWSALEDTAGAVSKVALFLLVTTLALNAFLVLTERALGKETGEHESQSSAE